MHIAHEDWIINISTMNNCSIAQHHEEEDEKDEEEENNL